VSDVLITALEVLAVVCVAVGCGVLVASQVDGAAGTGAGLLAAGVLFATAAAVAGWAGRGGDVE